MNSAAARFRILICNFYFYILIFINQVFYASAPLRPKLRGSEAKNTAGFVSRADCPGKEIKLSPKQFNLLEFFVKRQGRALTRDEILNQVWGYDCYVTQRSIDRFVTTLRNKIEHDPHRPIFIHTIREVGYRFEPE